MTFSLRGPLLLVGAGKMGSALLSGWLKHGLDPSLVIVQGPAPGLEARELMRAAGVRWTAELATIENAPDAIVVALKPQAIDAAFPALAKLAGPETVVLSIAAGKPLASFERHLSADAAVVRAMPNTPAAIGRGITGAIANAHVTPSQTALCGALLSAVGEVVWIKDEALMDAVTAVSGSGPAYVFLLVECLSEAGVAAGLDAKTAEALARATVAGSGELLGKMPDDAATLRQNVTSPGGTTAAALEILMREDGLKALMREAVLAAKKRGRELGQ